MTLRNLTLVGILALGSTTVFAAGRPIPADKLDSYKTAVDIQMTAASDKVTCSGNPGVHASPSIQEDLRAATSGIIQDNGSQPLLVFETDFNNGSSKDIISLTTTADLKNLVSVTEEGFNLQIINTGTLENPSISESWVSQGVETCTIAQ